MAKAVAPVTGYLVAKSMKSLQEYFKKQYVLALPNWFQMARLAIQILLELVEKEWVLGGSPNHADQKLVGKY